MQSEVPEMRKALTMLRNVPLYHLPSYQIHGSWKSNRPPFSVCSGLYALGYHYSIFCRKLSSRRYAKNPVCLLTNWMETGIMKIERAHRKRSAPTKIVI